MAEYVDGDVSMVSEFLDLVSLGTAFPFQEMSATIVVNVARTSPLAVKDSVALTGERSCNYRYWAQR
ncbi:hypothetical protein NKZ03_08470 [Sinorhizobium meliloti]|uniref:hypothetical protein n=1 Tax=Rhizobium meliloti TaxID=382 RepID=UPI00299D78BF